MAVDRQAGREGLSFSSSLRVQGPGAWVFVAGQLGTDGDGAIVPGGMAEEARATLENVLKEVAAAGGTAADIVKITAYLTSLDDYQVYNTVRAQVFGEALPASASVQVVGLVNPQATIEIEAIAFVPLEG